MTAPRVDHQSRAEDIRWLADTGESATGAARRLGMTYTALEKWTRVHGMIDVWHRLRARDPFDPTDTRSQVRLGTAVGMS